MSPEETSVLSHRFDNIPATPAAYMLSNIGPANKLAGELKPTEFYRGLRALNMKARASPSQLPWPVAL